MTSALGRSSEAARQRLLSAALAGQEGTLAKLLEMHRATLLASARRKLAMIYIPGQSGSDIVQEVFARAVRHFARFRGNTPPQFASWLSRILRNHINDLIKLQSQVVPEKLRAAAKAHRQGEPSPSSQLRRHDEADRLRRLVASMPEPYRSVAVLKYIEGVEDFASIAAELGRAENTVRQQWRRGLRWLHDQEQLDDFGRYEQ